MNPKAVRDPHVGGFGRPEGELEAELMRGVETTVSKKTPALLLWWWRVEIAVFSAYAKAYRWVRDFL